MMKVFILLYNSQYIFDLNFYATKTCSDDLIVCLFYNIKLCLFSITLKMMAIFFSFFLILSLISN